MVIDSMEQNAHIDYNSSTFSNIAIPLSICAIYMTMD